MTSQTVLLVIGGIPIQWIAELLKSEWDLMFTKVIPEELPLNLSGVVLWELGDEIL